MEMHGISVYDYCYQYSCANRQAVKDMTRIPKEFIKLFGPVALGVILVASWFLHSRNQSHLELVSERQATMVALVSRAVTRDISTHASDAQFLARLVARHIGNGDTTPLRDIEDAFSDFARSRQLYFTLRFIDKTGTEKIRVDRSFAGPVISPPGEFQNKAARYYFTETMRAGMNDVYISNFDLNIEHGRLEVPFRPTLRFGCPVIDRTGRKLGVVILNFDGKILLSQVEQYTDSQEGMVLLSNGDGYWMLGPTPEEEWGHIIEGAAGHSMADRFAPAWERISQDGKAQFQTKQGLFTFDTVGIVPDAILSDVPLAPDEAKRRWKVLTWVAPDQLTVPWESLYVLIVVLCLGMLALCCWYLADNRIRQIRVESQLRENEERTLAISQSSQDAIAMIDQTGVIIHWNPAAERLFGYRSEEVMGLMLHDMLPPEAMRPDAHRGLSEFTSSGQGKIMDRVIQVEALHKDGSYIPVELAVASFEFKGQWYAVGSMRDTTQRKRDEQELRRSEETSRALINAPTDSAMLIEPNGAIVAINEVGARRLGGTADRLIGKNAYELLAPDFVGKHKDVIVKVRETSEPVTFEDTHGDRTMLINVYPVKAPDDSVDRLAIFIRDVTEQRQAEAALVRSEQRFRDVSEAVGEFIWETNSEGALEFITDDVSLVVGYTAEELTGSMPFEFLPKEDIDDFRHWRAGIHTRREPFSNIEIRVVTKDGRIIWLQISGIPYFEGDGLFQGFRGAAMNITDRKASENAIKASERKLRALAESAYDAIVMIDNNGLVSFWNDAAEQLFGYTEEEALGHNVHGLIAPPSEQHDADVGMGRFSLTGQGPAVGNVTEQIGQHKDGTQFPVERSISSFRLGNAWYAVATIRDITERKATEAKLRELATTDSLTGLFNRRRFMELSEREFARSIRYERPLALFMLDIDHFKRVNDEHGHDVGDQVLRSLSEIAIMALRNADILGRLGGEEFGVLLPETDTDAAFEVAERLRLSIERSSINTSDGNLSITVSIGVAILQPGTQTIANLLKRADVALYDAKQSGRNRVVMG